MSAAALSGTQLNIMKLARELGISPAFLNDTIESMGGYSYLWTRAQQDQTAEGSSDLEFFTA
jgi:hypothetical protein